MMKRVLLIVAFSLFAATSLNAQPFQLQISGSTTTSSDDVKAMKVAFFADYLELTPAEGEKFWPLYNEFWKKREELTKKRYDLYKRICNNEATKSDGASLVGYEKDINDLERTYYEKYLQFMSPAKSAKALIADEVFKIQTIRGRGYISPTSLMDTDFEVAEILFIAAA